MSSNGIAEDELFLQLPGWLVKKYHDGAMVFVTNYTWKTGQDMILSALGT